MPTSVLLAVLAAAGLLALAPALVRRYDATERLVAERAISTARVLSRQRRRRTVPGRRPIRPPRALCAMPVSAPPALQTARPGGRRSADESGNGPSRTPLRLVGQRERAKAKPGRRHRPAVYRRRRLLAGLVLLNLVQLAGVLLVSPGFLISVSVTGSVLLLYVAHLRGQALRLARRRRAEERQAQWLAEQQAQVRLAQRRRALARREAARLLQEELLRAQEELAALQAQADTLAAAAPPPPRVATISYRGRQSGVRGKPYHAGPAA
ncbi:divisome protein SepX/GlpR [Catellatospora methionotrophica]|uniref:divisome protein SepX/GlpR n=1 Tax=Catellatospora methionotrophica TaxID=121620 RepID=UPI0033C83607